MRIVGGKYKGRRIKVAKNLKARPTTDFAKEALFNILNNNFSFNELRVLDLFSGTGSITFEFVSRGAKHVDLVEYNNIHLRYIRETLKELEINNVSLIRGDAFKILKRLRTKYDLIFADPPYELEGIDELPDFIFLNKMLNSGGWFILEHSGKYDFSEHQWFKELRCYGSVHFSVFEAKNMV